MSRIAGRIIPAQQIGESLVPDVGHFEDNEKFYFGTGDDAEVYHSGTHFYIDNNVGDTYIIGGSSTSEILLQPNNDTDDYFTFKTDTNVPTIFGTGAYLRIGDAAFSSRGLTAEDDLLVTGKLEVDGILFLEGGVYLHQNVPFLFGIGVANFGGLQYSADDGIHLYTGATDGTGNNNYIITGSNNYLQDHDHDTMSTNPTLIIHSATDVNTDNTQYLSLFHDTGDSFFKSNTGAVNLWGKVVGGTNTVNIQGEQTSFGLHIHEVLAAHDGTLFDAAALTDNAVIWQQPADTVLLGVGISLDRQFVAASMTDLDVWIGDAGDNDGLLLQAMNLTSDLVDTIYRDRGAYWSAATQAGYYTNIAKDWTAYATAVGANLNTTTDGGILFTFFYLG